MHLVYSCSSAFIAYCTDELVACNPVLLRRIFQAERHVNKWIWRRSLAAGTPNRAKSDVGNFKALLVSMDISAPSTKAATSPAEKSINDPDSG